MYSYRQDGQARDKLSTTRTGLRDFFCVWHFKVIVWQKVSINSHSEVCFYQVLEPMGSRLLMGFRNILKLFV